MHNNNSELFIKLYLDENIYWDLAKAIRQRGFDAISAAEAGMLEKSDPEQLEYAASQNRAILTFNMGDFDRLCEEWWSEGREHAGIIITQPMTRGQFGELLRRVLKLLNQVAADEMRNQLIYLPR